MRNTMTREEVQKLLPEYLAGELDPAMRATFEESLAHHPDLSAEARSLSHAVGALRSLDEPGSPIFRAVSRSLTTRMMFSALRYAAVIAVAFTVGFSLRGTASSASDPVATPALANIDPANRTILRSAVEQRLIEGYARGSGAGTNLGRSLIALAHAADTTSH
jgi:hypothetical protein